MSKQVQEQIFGLASIEVHLWAKVLAVDVWTIAELINQYGHPATHPHCRKCIVKGRLVAILPIWTNSGRVEKRRVEKKKIGVEKRVEY